MTSERKSRKRQNEKFNKEMKTIKKNQTNSWDWRMAVMKNSIEVFNSRLDQEEKRTIELEDK